MNLYYSFKIYSSYLELPTSWDSLATKNIFLTKHYFEILEKSAPTNMECHYIGLFHKEELIGIALSQFIDANQLISFGDRDKCVKTFIRNFFFKNFSSRVLFVGNNMLTGQNAFSFSDTIDKKLAVETIKKATEELKIHYKNIGKKVHLTTFKDFDISDLDLFENNQFKDFFRFTIQQNMIFEIPHTWKSNDDYIASLSKKYRDQYKRSHHRAIGINKRKLNLEEIINLEETIYELYFHVAQNAPFNTFFLAKNHFRVFKEILKDKFLFYGYFLDEKLIGFNTLIKNGDTIDTYFLGYDNVIQKEKMLYLNMLYDMIAYSINKGYREIVFARTALEIKSSVGAKPENMFGLIEHSNKLLNNNMSRIFKYLEPEASWKERNPFK